MGIGNAMTAQRRRAELRKVGIEFVSDLSPGVRVNVGTVLHATPSKLARCGSGPRSLPT